LKINEEHLSVRKTARYHTNSPTSKITSVNFVIHGYATLAKNFITEFSFLESDNTLIIAPEGLSKFYFRNNLGASWMTIEDRSNEIEDYIAYLDDLFKKIRSEYDISGAKVNLLGFSQGVHTAARWFIGSEYKFDKLVLCSSDFPKDANFERLKLRLKDNSKMFFIYGTNDKIIENSAFENAMKMLRENEIKFSHTTFKGGHNIDAGTVKMILE